jgi:polysaccharide biosynthesis/export protein
MKIPTMMLRCSLRTQLLWIPMLCLVAAFAFVGCDSADLAAPVQLANSQPPPQTIRPGDVIKVSFPGSPNLDTQQQVRRDGRITLSLVGEVLAAGSTPTDLEKDLLQRYSTQILSKEVNVTVVSSSFPIFVSGAVVRPGKIEPDHPITALEAVMEAGGFDGAKANMSAVEVIRQEPGGTKNFTLNLRAILDGKSTVPFYLKPADIVFVPEKFSWF